MRRHALAALLATATALYKVDIHIAGRAPSPKSWEAAAVDEYAKRRRGTIDLRTTWHKSGDQLEKLFSTIADCGGVDDFLEAFEGLNLSTFTTMMGMLKSLDFGDSGGADQMTQWPAC